MSTTKIELHTAVKGPRESPKYQTKDINSSSNINLENLSDKTWINGRGREIEMVMGIDQPIVESTDTMTIILKGRVECMKSHQQRTTLQSAGYQYLETKLVSPTYTREATSSHNTKAIFNKQDSRSGDFETG